MHLQKSFQGIYLSTKGYKSSNQTPETDRNVTGKTKSIVEVLKPRFKEKEVKEDQNYRVSSFSGTM